MWLEREERKAWKPACGDRVVVRDWYDMEAEFGTNGSGSIRCLHSFTIPMRQFCGGTATIEELNEEWNKIVLDFDDHELNKVRGHFIFSKDMIEPYEDTQEDVVSDTQELLWLYGVNN